MLWIVSFSGAVHAETIDSKQEPTPEVSVDKREPVEEYVRVLRTGCFSPFQTVEWSVVTLADTPVARLRKTLVDYSENLGAMRLLTREEGAALWSDLEALDLPWQKEGEDSPPGESDGSCSYQIDIARKGKVLRFQFDADGEGTGGPGPDIAKRVQATIEEFVEHVPFRNVFFEPGIMGFVDVDSVPPARVYIDGRDTQITTPLETYEVKEGEHSLTLRSLDGSLERTYTFRVQAGMTTVLRLDLR